MAFGKPARRRLDNDQRIMPLINVVFLLLIFFMVAGQLSKTDPVKIKPPVSDSESEAGEPLVQLLVTAEGRLLLAGTDVAADELLHRVRSMLDGRRDRTVHVKADGAADAAAIIGLLEKIKAAGAERVKLLTSVRTGQ